MNTMPQHEKEKMLDALKTTIEKLPKERHLEILRRLMKHQNTITISSNRYGVYVNLSFLPDPIVEEIRDYVSFVTTQEQELEAGETARRRGGSIVLV